MAIYLKKFENHTQYENYINDSGAILPNVSICTTEGDVHYNPLETRVVAKFKVLKPDTGRVIRIAPITDNISAIEIDGVAQPSVVSAYTFNTTGEHTVKYTLTDPTSISSSAFASCTNLSSVDIPNSVTTIGGSAFEYCTSLTSVTIGSGVTSIGDYVFATCRVLSSITSLNKTAPTIQSGTFYGVKNGGTLTVPSGSSGYDVWMGTGNYYLGYHGWTKVEQ